MTVVRSLLLFVAAAVAEIGGAWLVWQGVREHRGWLWVGAGVVALGLYGLVATLQPDATSVASSQRTAVCCSQGPSCGGWRWTVSVPTAYDVVGALVCLVGVGVIMYAPRAG